MDFPLIAGAAALFSAAGEALTGRPPAAAAAQFLYQAIKGNKYGKYGDIMKVETTGASRLTAQGDNLKYSGVKASEAMARNDANRMNKYRYKIQRVADEYDIDPALIAAIISRESRAGNDLKKGWGDHNRAFGLMQVDKRHHKPKGEWDSEEHLRQATKILVDFIEIMQDKFSDLSKEKQLKGGIAAYNMGDGNVHSYDEVDENTTGGDYSNDVVARAQWFKRYRNY